MSVTSKENLRSLANEAVQVIVRCRPISNKERKNENFSVVECFPSRGVIEVQNPKARSENEKNKIFTYDAVYGESSTQQSIYDETVRPLVSSVLEGYNGCVFAYGQTGTGKTFTMEGIPNDEEDRGIVPRAFEQIWGHINRTEGVEFLVTVRYLEIYMEEIRDLLKSKHTKTLELREDNQGVYVTHLHSQTCQSSADMMKAMKLGNHNRTTGSTNMNEHSSRSHAIFQIVIEMAEGTSKSVKVGKLNLIDLAGSERQAKTGATGDRLKEATKINKALSSLGNVIYALAENSAHIPYRDSKLTRLLQDSLGGNSKTIMIANVGPANTNYDETIITLRYAYRAKSIKNQPIKNEDIKNTKLLELQQEIERLKMLIQEKNSGVEHSGEIEYISESEDDDEPDDKKEEKVKKLELGKVEVGELAKKLKSLENQMVHGGKNIIDSVNENEIKLEQQQLEIAARKKTEVEMQQKIELEEETFMGLQQVFASLQQEVDFKREKLKRLHAKLQSVRQEIKDTQDEYVRNRTEIEESNDETAKLLRKKFLIIDNFVPTEERQRLINMAQFDEDLDNWIMKKELYKVSRPIAHNYRRPISEHAVNHCINSSKYRGENILHNIKLDMPLRTTQEYTPPSVCPQIKAIVSNAILQDMQTSHIIVKLPPHSMGLKHASKIEKDGKYKQATKNVVDINNSYRRQQSAKPVF